MNHRSNTEYIIVVYMAANRATLSYTVGAWACTWPLQSLIKSLGGFVRRESDNPLYRRVLAPYVQMATAGGVVQAFYPERQLTRDGYLQKPRFCLINYMLSAFAPKGERDLVFIPAGINYDRAMEDRTLVGELDPQAIPLSGTYTGPFSGSSATMSDSCWNNAGIAWLCLCRFWNADCHAVIHRTHQDRFLLDLEDRFEAVERLGSELFGAIAITIPVLPVPLIATVFLRHPHMAMSELEIKTHAHALINDLEQRGAYVHIPRSNHTQPQWGFGCWYCGTWCRKRTVSTERAIPNTICCATTPTR